LSKPLTSQGTTIHDKEQQSTNNKQGTTIHDKEQQSTNNNAKETTERVSAANGT
jgi:hypothetical protein